MIQPRGPHGRFASNKTVPVTQLVAGTQPQLTNHIAIVLDRSMSMQRIKYEVVKQFNAQIHTIKEQARLTGQKTLVSLYTFAYDVKIPFFEVQSESLYDLLDYQYLPSGNTAMFDGVCRAINDISRVKDSNELDTSFLIWTLTDGEENASQSYTASSFYQMIRSKEGTDRWSFVFSVPRSGAAYLQGFGIPAGNIQTWEATITGTRDMGSSTASAFSNYYTARSAGARSTKSFHTTNLAGVSPAELRRALVDVTPNYLRLNVALADCTKTNREGKWVVPIEDFVSKTTGRNYVKGSGYYELMKAEEVQEYKGIVIQDKTTNILYTGMGTGTVEVRRVLGLPEYGTVKVHPGNHAEYRIFVQSTSLNRNLIPGTVLLLKA